jgi:hypothetical protein
MARPRTPDETKPRPTTISMTKQNRDWLDNQAGVTNSEIVNKLIDDHRTTLLSPSSPSNLSLQNTHFYTSRILSYLSQPNVQAIYHRFLLIWVVKNLPHLRGNLTSVNGLDFHQVGIAELESGLEKILLELARIGYSTRLRSGQDDTNAYWKMTSPGRETYFRNRSRDGVRVLLQKGVAENLFGLSTCGRFLLVPIGMEVEIRAHSDLYLELGVLRLAADLLKWTDGVKNSPSPNAVDLHLLAKAESAIWHGLGVAKRPAVNWIKKIYSSQISSVHCVYTSKSGKSLHYDHILPWRRIGSTGHHAGNLVPCTGVVNSQKSDRLPGPSAWKAIYEFYSLHPTLVAALKLDLAAAGGPVTTHWTWVSWFDFVRGYYDGIIGAQVWEVDGSITYLSQSDIDTIQDCIQAIGAL